MLIMPLAIIISRTVFRAPKLGSGHPLERLGLESTFLLFAGILVAYAALRAAPQSVFPILATTIGARYLVFRTIYAEPLYWLLATALIAVGGSTLLYAIVWPVDLAVIVGCVEVAFAAALLYHYHLAEAGAG